MPNEYTFTDRTAAQGPVYAYRLKQIDRDGAFTYSHVIETAIDPPCTFDLEQNFPNPFNPTTVIRYALPAASRVMLDVYTTLGVRVAVLADEFQEAGYRTVEFNAVGLASGVYLYQLRAGSFVDTKKLVLVR